LIDKKSTRTVARL